VEPVFDSVTGAALSQLIEERHHADRLLDAGLAPTSKVLLTGPPGVGKTLSARYLARSLGLPLFILDLSAVMSSFLGRTGVNLRHVLDFAQSQPSVLLLDELDAIAKRRDDSSEIGELKRLVTVLLQEIDGWRSDGLLLAATNHPALLDPAVWRRFDVVLEFPLPDADSIAKALPRFLEDEALDPAELALVSEAFSGSSFSDIERSVLAARRASAVQQQPVIEALMAAAHERISRLPLRTRTHLATRLVTSRGLSQRRVCEITGVSRDTIRKTLRSLKGTAPTSGGGERRG